MIRTVINNEDLGYGRLKVLERLSFAYRDGEKIAILGRSGSGKTTLLQTIYQRCIKQHDTISLIPQDTGLVPQLSVFHNVYMGRLERHHMFCNLLNWLWPTEKNVNAILPIVQRVGLQAFLHTPVDQLSGGEKQRVAMARAIYRGGDILLGDEPVSSVDEIQAETLLSEMRDQFRTAVVVLHDTALARRFATRIIGLKGKRIAIDAAPTAVSQFELDGLYARA